jgi:biopolymer transport protein ExbD/Zn-dependent protease with chaperone function
VSLAVAVGTIGPAVGAIGRTVQILLTSVNLVTGFLLLGAWVASRVLERKVAASLRLLLFAAVFARLALPHDWSNPLGLLGRAALPTAAGAAATMPEGTLSLASAAEAGRSDPALWLGAGYLLVLAVLLARWIAARWSLARQLSAARPSALAAVGNAPVTEHATLGPLVAGILRPRIVLPAAFVRTADAETLSFVLAHEAAHLARRDHWLVAAVQLATIVAWPVLPLWLAARQIRALCELACDEAVLAGQSSAQRRRYGEALLRLSGDDFALAATPLVPSFAWDLRRRLRALGSQRRWHRGGQWALVGTCAGLLLACSGAPEKLNPTVATGASDEGASSPLLVLTSTGALVLDDVPVELKDFEGRLRAALTATGTDGLRIRTDKALDKAAAAEIMSAAKRAGATTIHLVTGSDQRTTPISEASGGDLLTTPGGGPRPGPVPDFVINAPSLTITTTGELQLNGRAVDRQTFEADLHALLTASDSHALRVYGVSGLSALFPEELMSAANRAGARQIYFVPMAGALGRRPCPPDAQCGRKGPFPLPGSEVPSPAVPPAASDKRGSLDKEIIRGVIRANIQQVKACHEAGLARGPGMAGRVEAVFTIGRTGKVVSAGMENSTLGDPEVAACIAREVRRWVFPAPSGGGIVVVRYPFSFQPAEAFEVRSSRP